MAAFTCPECGREFSSSVLFDKHLYLNSEEVFLNTFRKVAVEEIDSGRHPELENIVNTNIIPKLNEIAEARRQIGGFTGEANKMKRPLNNKHKGANAANQDFTPY